MLGFNDNVPEKIKRRREFTFLVFSGIFLGSLTMLNILGLTKVIEFQLFTVDVKIPIGVLPYPVTFLCTDFISEIYGRRRANNVVWVGLLLNLWVLFILWLGGTLPPETTAEAFADRTNTSNGWIFYEIQKMTFSATFASMIAYLTAQFVDVHVFHFLKKKTKGKHLWLRNNGSTLVSQLVDSFAVILIAHYYADAFRDVIDKNPGTSEFSIILTIIFSSYIFKFISALLDTIPFYLGTKWFSSYLMIDPNHGYSEDVANKEED